MGKILLSTRPSFDTFGPKLYDEPFSSSGSWLIWVNQFLAYNLKTVTDNKVNI